MSTNAIFTTTEAAYLANACLAESSLPKPLPPRKVLVQVATGEGKTARLMKALVTERLVHKAIEEHVVRSKSPKRVFVDTSTVLYLASTKLLCEVSLSAAGKKRLYKALGGKATLKPVEIAPALLFDVGRCAARWRRLVDTYAADRERYIASDTDIMGGLPVIKGTRIPVYSVLARLEGGDSIEDWVNDYPGVPRKAFEAAVAYAKTHPRRGRPTKRFR